MDGIRYLSSLLFGLLLIGIKRRKLGLHLRELRLDLCELRLQPCCVWGRVREGKWVIDGRRRPA